MKDSVYLERMGFRHIYKEASQQEDINKQVKDMLEDII